MNVSQSARVDASLQVGQATQEVTVSAAPPAIETDRVAVQTQLSSAQISSLPISNRNFTNLALLTPGSVVNTFQHAPSENPQQSTLVNTGGQEFAGTNYQLDGMNNNDTVLGITMVNPAVDSVEHSQLRATIMTQNIKLPETSFRSKQNREPTSFTAVPSNFSRTIFSRPGIRSRRVCMRLALLLHATEAFLHCIGISPEVQSAAPLKRTKSSFSVIIKGPREESAHLNRSGFRRRQSEPEI